MDYTQSVNHNARRSFDLKMVRSVRRAADAADGQDKVAERPAPLVLSGSLPPVVQRVAFDARFWWPIAQT